MRFLTLSWDDGFRRSSLRTAQIFERFGLQAEFNVVATVGGSEHGDFALWNELQARGHVIQPHGYQHADKSKLPLREAQRLILRCLEVFSTRLEGFAASTTIFAFPYNASTPELEAWLPRVVRAYRTGPGPTLNPLPAPGTLKLTTTGCQDAEAGLQQGLKDLQAAEAGWLIYNIHGLDGEGWGPVRADYLLHLLDSLVGQPHLRILPARDVLNAALNSGLEAGAATADQWAAARRYP